MNKFWMVVGEGVPYFRHDTLRSAEKEAERLAVSNHGARFTVLEAIKTVVKSDVVWTELNETAAESESDVPF